MATNLYHTSAPGIPAQELIIAGFDGLAKMKVPAVLVQVVPGVNVVAPVDSSLVGGSCTQMLYVQLAPEGFVVGV